MTLEVQPVTRERWDDLAALIETSPVTRLCWCMWPRVPVGEMRARTAEQNRAGLRAVIEAGEIPGLLAYEQGRAVAWCSVGPRPIYGRFNSLPEDSTWLIACVFARASHRARGVTSALLEAAIGHAKEHGAMAIEALPTGWRPDDDPASLERLAGALRRLGFHHVADRETAGRLVADVRPAPH